MTGTGDQIDTPLTSPGDGSGRQRISQEVIAEMVTRTVEDGGQISVISGTPARMAARLHVPVSR